VVQKKPVVKEEIRLRKDVVHERQIVEENLRREEVDIEDDTRHRRG
jgi:stress response protein YsnF